MSPAKSRRTPAASPRWPVKLILPVGFGLVALQGVSEIIKCIAVFAVPGYKREHAYEKPLQ